METPPPPRPLIAILADMPLGRLLPDEFREVDRSLTPWIYSLFRDFAHQNEYDIHWITLKKYVRNHLVRKVQNQTIHILPDSSLALGLFTGHLITIRQLKKTLSELQPELVHAWGIELPYARACMTQSCAQLLSYQGALHAYCRRVHMSLYPRLQAFWERKTTPHFDHITCESPWSEECVRELNPHASVYQIDYGIEEVFQNTERKLTERPSCLFAGTLCERKGLPDLIQAFQHQDLAHVDLFLAGRGNLRESLEKNCGENIHWLGDLSRTQLKDQLEKTWCLVLPTLADTGPTIIKETRYMGIPVITTTEAGCKQYIRHGMSGFVIPPHDPEAIKEAVLSVTKSKEVSVNMGLYQLDHIRKNLDIHLTSEKFLNVYKKLLKI